jgi:hypothetical protein
MSVVNIAEPGDPDERQRLELPPLVGEWNDLRVAWQNWVNGEPLCGRCRGTGNELFSMFKACMDCGGSGVRRDGVHRGLQIPAKVSA